MSSPAVSVVVPAYNAAASLPGCLAALASQGYPRAAYEIIVVDDGSQDGTTEAAAGAGADRVLSVPHGGPAAARNAGARAARGEILLFTDADCEPLPDWISEMVRPFADPAVAGVKGSYRTRQAQTVARLAQCEFAERYDLLERRSAIDFVDSYSAGFRREVFLAAGGFDPAFPYPNNEDVDLSYRLAEAGRVLVFNRRAAVYHRHPATWADYLRLKVGRGYWRMVVYRRHPGKALHDSYTPQALKLQVLLMAGAASLAALAVLPVPRARARRWPAVAGAGACLGALLGSSLPFARLAARQDRGVAAWAPLFVVGRAAAFAVGVAAGAVGMFLFHDRVRGEAPAGAARPARAG